MDKQYYIYGLGLCCEQKNWFNACELSLVKWTMRLLDQAGLRRHLMLCVWTSDLCATL